LPAPVDAVVLRMQPRNLRNEEIVTQLPGRRGTADSGAVSAGGEEALHCRPEDAADELDPETIPVLVDESDHLGQGRSSSFAKNTLAAFRISFAFRNSETSFSSCLIRAAASVVTPGLVPASTSYRRCHSRNVSGLIPSSPATCLTALIRFGCSGRASASIRNARSRISGEYFLFIEFHPCLKNGTKVRPIQPEARTQFRGHLDMRHYGNGMACSKGGCRGSHGICQSLWCC